MAKGIYTGTIEKDENGNFIMLDNDVYIIGDVIEIPKFEI